MFGNNNKKETTSKPKTSTLIPTTSSHSLNSLVQGTVIEGTVKSESDIRIDGAIKGKLFCDAKVIIGPTGSIEGEIKCKNAVVEGKFDGSIIVEELLHIREQAQINGDVTTGKLIVQSGATFNVTCNMGNAKSGGFKSNKSLSSSSSSILNDSAKAAKPAEVRG